MTPPAASVTPEEEARKIANAIVYGWRHDRPGKWCVTSGIDLQERIAFALRSREEMARREALEEAEQIVLDHEWLPHLPVDQLKDCLLDCADKIRALRRPEADSGGTPTRLGSTGQEGEEK